MRLRGVRRYRLDPNCLLTLLRRRGYIGYLDDAAELAAIQTDGLTFVDLIINHAVAEQAGSTDSNFDCPIEVDLNRP
jgi:hypothetical protein